MYYNEVLMQVMTKEVEATSTKQAICESLEAIGFKAFGESLDNLVDIVKEEKARIFVYRAIHKVDTSMYVLHAVESISIKQNSFNTTDVALMLKSVEEIAGIGQHVHVDTFTFNPGYYAGPIYTNRQSSFVREQDYPDMLYKLDDTYVLI